MKMNKLMLLIVSLLSLVDATVNAVTTKKRAHQEDLYFFDEEEVAPIVQTPAYEDMVARRAKRQKKNTPVEQVNTNSAVVAEEAGDINREVVEIINGIINTIESNADVQNSTVIMSPLVANNSEEFVVVERIREELSNETASEQSDDQSSAMNDENEAPSYVRYLASTILATAFAEMSDDQSSAILQHVAPAVIATVCAEITNAYFNNAVSPMTATVLGVTAGVAYNSASSDLIERMFAVARNARDEAARLGLGLMEQYRAVCQAVQNLQNQL